MKTVPAFGFPLSPGLKGNKPRILQSQIRSAAEIWETVHSDPCPADRWLSRYFRRFRKKFGSRDRRFLAETVYALFRHKIFLEAWAGHLRKFRDFEWLALSAAACEQIIPRQDFENGASGLIPGEDPGKIYDCLSQRILPPAIRPASVEEEIALKFSFPLWLVRRWSSSFGIEKTKSLLSAMQKRPPLVIRANPIKISRRELLKRFTRRGLEAEPTAESPYGIIFKERLHLSDSEEFRGGFFEIQDEASQIAAAKVDPQPGEVIWDVCAGGGGKSLMFAALMKNRGRIIATDIRAAKLKELKKRAKRAGAHNIFPADLSGVSGIREAKKGIDKIVVDAPCSGTGTLRRNPDAKWKLTEKKFQAFHEEQVRIVEKSLALLKKGGRLYYMTCSIEPPENEQVVEEILRRHPEIGKVPVSGSGDGYLRLWPDEHETDGFFLAAVEKA